jgi:hypothetical protein
LCRILIYSVCCYYCLRKYPYQRRRTCICNLKGIKPFTDYCKVQLHAETQYHPEHITLFFLASLGLTLWHHVASYVVTNGLELFVSYSGYKPFLSWRWKQYVSPKCWQQPTRLHDDITYKPTVWNFISRKTSDLRYHGWTKFKFKVPIKHNVLTIWQIRHCLRNHLQW